MDFVVDFYKGLDTLNLIIFWGVIIVIVLLLIFSIIVVNKNRKLKEMLIKEKINLAIKEDGDISDLPIVKETTPVKNEETVILSKESSAKQNNDNDDLKVQPIEEEKVFIAEEHVLEYQNNHETEKTINTSKIINNNRINKVITQTDIPREPYQKNVLREMSLSQTSPIGIIKKKEESEKNITKAEELHNILNGNIDNFPDIDTYHVINESGSRKETVLPSRTNNVNSGKQNYGIDSRYIKSKPYKSNETVVPNREKYLAEVSRKLSEASNLDNVSRTEYELRQEEEAIISYEELMQKKDSIKILDEEDAIISIEELMQKKSEENKLYNLTEEEENTKFINELKNFRSDL